jgi:uncharacterized protein
LELYELISNDFIELENLIHQDLKDVQQLIELGILVESEFDETLNLEMLGEKEKYRTDKELHITIAPTMACNMKCPYCFQTKEINETIMKLEICDQVVDFIQKRILGRPYLHITWFGGEPLLAMKQIAYISSKLIEICTDNNVIYNSSIVTNGYNLTRENVLDLSRKYMVSSVQVTIDGLKEQHNRKRILKESGDGFSRIIRNVKFASDYLRVVIRVNVDNENKSTLIDLIDYLLVNQELAGKVSIGISPVFDFDDKKNCNYGDYCTKDSWNSESLKALKHFVKLDHIDNFASAAMQASLASCSANLYESFIFDSDGDIYKCFLSFGKKKYSIGHVNDINKNQYLVNNRKHKMWIDAKHSFECNECQYLPLCQSGCLFERLEKGKSHICFKSKDNIKQILMEMYLFFYSLEKTENNLLK